MRTLTWVLRLTDQLPGWSVWYSSSPAEGGTPSRPQRALTHTAALQLPYRIGPFRTPQELREAARERYADGDTCQTCNDDWRICGHRQPRRGTCPREERSSEAGLSTEPGFACDGTTE
jgi:hypothetical protein